VGSKKEFLANVGLLALRLAVGLQLVWLHGWDKLSHFSSRVSGFPDPFKIGSRESLIATVLAEVLCAALVVLGLGTRVAALLLAFVTGVFAFFVQAGHSWARRETMLLYFAGSLAILMLGPGRFSLDGLMGGGARKGGFAGRAAGKPAPQH
jgi:putative oxidoreductase